MVAIFFGLVVVVDVFLVLTTVLLCGFGAGRLQCTRASRFVRDRPPQSAAHIERGQAGVRGQRVRVIGSDRTTRFLYTL